MTHKDKDKDKERKRYNEIASNVLRNSKLPEVNVLTPPLKIPTLNYRLKLNEYVNSDSRILEIGAGMGENTSFLLETGARVLATDISNKSLFALKNRFNTSRLTTQVEDMERLSFNNDKFDVVCSAGSLSYGDNDVVMNEIYRVLKKGGVMIAVDSLNNNPVYRLNRYMHYLKGNRSKSTLIRMPTISLIDKYTEKFGYAEVKFFGAITWIFPLLRKVLSDQMVGKISNWIDTRFNIKASAFKFVIILVKK
jgi:SAM-dependent methyltransferase